MVKEKGIGSIVSGIFKFLFEGGIDAIKEKVQQTQRRIMQQLYAGLLMLTGIVFVAIAAALMLPDFFGVSRGMSFLIIGLALIIFAFVIKSQSRNE